MDRQDIIKIIPEPKNQDIIVYDLTLKDLLDKNVFEEYYNSLSEYKLKKEKYMILDEKIKQYEKDINNIYFYNNKWNKTDYMEALQRAKMTYSNMFGDLKKLENNIEILTKKIQNINQQIEIQKHKEQKEIENKKDNLDNEIKSSKENINFIESQISKIEAEQKVFLDIIKDFQEEINLCVSMQADLNKKRYKCKYCGTTISSEKGKERVTSLLQKNIEEKFKKLNEIQEKADIRKREISALKKELSQHKSDLKNNLEFKKQDYNFYTKKSIKLLQLESARDQFQKKLLEFKKQLESSKESKSKEYLELKDLIFKYETSLENLEKIQENKLSFSENYKESQQLKNELLDIYEKLKKYKKFIEIYYKIYEQKAADYFGNGIKFKLYRFNSFELEKIFEVYYNDVEYSQLSKYERQQVDSIYAEKISTFL